jgi:EcsC protein family
VTEYEQKAIDELASWQREMKLLPSLVGDLAKGFQNRVNRIIPEKIHAAITAAIKQMVRAVIFGSEYTTARPLADGTLEEREKKVRRSITIYKNTAATEGAITGFGGVLLGLADFPLWLSLKMKLLHEIATLYGFDVSEYKERIYILHIFQITFSGQRHRNKIIRILENWEVEQENLPGNISEFDWRTFQLEYRDYIDIAKLLQLVPFIGAPVGAYVNHRLTQKLGKTAMNAYRLRWTNHKLLK